MKTVIATMAGYHNGVFVAAGSGYTVDDDSPAEAIVIDQPVVLLEAQPATTEVIAATAVETEVPLQPVQAEIAPATSAVAEPVEPVGQAQPAQPTDSATAQPQS